MSKLNGCIGWVLLNIGEIIRDGDEYELVHLTRIWYASSFVGQKTKTRYTYRRRGATSPLFRPLYKLLLGNKSNV